MYDPTDQVTHFRMRRAFRIPPDLPHFLYEASCYDNEIVKEPIINEKMHK